MASNPTKTRATVDVARFLGKSEYYIRQQITAGNLRASLVGGQGEPRFTPADIARFCRWHAAELRAEARRIVDLAKQAS